MSSKPPLDPWDVAAIEAKAPDEKSVKEARKVLAQGNVGKVEPRADGRGWWAVCRGLTGTYEVSVGRGPRGGLQTRCTCQSYKKPCKHALALLLYLAEHPEARPEAPQPEARAGLDLESLLRAAFAAPEEDTPRLALADYFEENGETDRAELIRVQCAMSHTPPGTDAGRELAGRAAGALAAIDKTFGKLPTGFSGAFVRGFFRMEVRYSKFSGGEGLPARFVRFFRDGWVETLRQLELRRGMIPLYRLVGTLDLSDASVPSEDVDVFVREFRPGHPETRTRIVRLPVGCEQRYRKLTAGSGGGSS